MQENSFISTSRATHQIEQKYTVESQLEVVNFKQKKQQKLPVNDHLSHQGYRPDIDGLRTVAVMIVIIFHAWPQVLTGGYIGVDVFFVISGYLISGIIIKQCRKDSFSFIDFYSRRVKRIYPALLCILFSVLALSLLKLLTKELQIVSKTMSAAAFFCANIDTMFYHNSYFDPYTHINFLLHLWSLGVQEQFYILWPFILYFTIKKVPKYAFFVMLAYTAGCFYYSIYIIEINAKMAFYFPLGRFWQLSIGGLIAFKDFRISNIFISNALALYGLYCINYSVQNLTGWSKFPGWQAVRPTMGAVFIILAGQKSLFNKYILSSAPFVFIGKISYPLYLWHWPLFVFSRTLFPKGSNSIFQSIWLMIALSFVLSIATYFLVENKVRYQKGRKVVLILVSLMAFIGIFSFLIWQNPGKFSIPYRNMFSTQIDFKPKPQDLYLKNGKYLPNSSKNKNRQQPTSDKIRFSIVDPYEHMLNDIYLFNKDLNSQSKYWQNEKFPTQSIRVINQGSDKQVFVIGDSHAQRLNWRFAQLFVQSIKNNKTQDFPTVFTMSKHGRAFVPTNQMFNFALRKVQKHQPQRILIIHHWLIYIDYWWTTPEASEQTKISRLKQRMDQFTIALKQLKETAPNAQIYVVHLKLWGQQFQPRNMVNFYGILQNNIKPVRYSEYRKQKRQVYERFQAVVNSANVTLIDFSEHECWQDICEVMIPTGLPILGDTNHEAHYYDKYWVSSADFVLDFEKNQSK